MGFAAPLALLGLLAIGIPVAAHLMRQKDLRVRTLPTLALLAKARAESRKRFRLRDRTLLALRVLAVVALVLAVAAPFIWRPSAFADGKLSSLVIVVDDSLSMQRRDGGGTALDQAIEQAIAAAEGLPEGSEVALVWAGAPARIGVSRSPSRGAVVRALRLARPGARGTDMEGAAALARRALSGARHRRRLLVLSDFAAHAAADAAEWPDAEAAFERVVEPGPSAAILHAVAAPNPSTGRLSVRAEVRTDDAREVRVETLDGELLATGTATPERGRADLTLEVDPGEAAALRVGIAGDDALPADDTRVVLVEPGAAAQVLLVDGDAAGAVGRGEVAYLSRALEVQPAQESSGRVRVRVVDADALDPRTLEDVDVVFLANVAAPSPAAAEALRAHHARGGGIVVTGGGRVRPRAWRARLGELLPGQLGAPSTARRTLQVLDEGLRGLDGVTADQALALDVAAGARVAARWSDGSPALVMGERVALWTSTFDEAWTDLPFHPGFVALVHRLSRELGSRPRVPTEVRAGQTLALNDELRVQDPAGDRWAGSAAFDRTDAPGLYEVLDDSGAAIARFVVAPPAEESDFGAGAVPSEEHGDGDVSASHRAPVGAWVFLFFGLLVLAEGATRTRRAAQ